MASTILEGPATETPSWEPTAPSSARETQRRWLGQPYVAMAAVALILRVCWMMVYRTYAFATAMHFQYAPELPNFPFGYETGSIARNLAIGNGFSSPFTVFGGPTAWIAPVYPYLCAAVFKLFGVYSQESAIVLLSLNSLFSALTCITIFKIAERTVGRTAGLWAGWAWAVVPFFMRWPTTWVWEISLSALLMSCLFLYTLKLDGNSGWKMWAGYGLLWGFAALTNPALLAALPFMELWAAGRLRRAALPYLRPAVISALVFFAAIMPWLIRNRLAMGEWVFIRDNFGFELRLGNYPSSNGMGWLGLHPTWNIFQLEKFQRMGELAYIEANQQQAMAFIKSRPAQFLALTGKRFLGFWNGEPLNYVSNEPWKPWMMALSSAVALYGLIVAMARRKNAAWLMGLVILFYPAAYYITYPHPRYRHAIEPLMLILIIFFISETAANFHHRLAALRRGKAEAG